MSCQWIHRKYYRGRNLLTSLNESVNMSGFSEGLICRIDASLLSDSENPSRAIHVSFSANEALRKILPILRGLQLGKSSLPSVVPVLERLNEILSAPLDEDEIQILGTEFVRWNGLLSLLSFLFCEEPRISLLAFKILNKLCIHVDEAGSRLSDSREILHFAFQSLTNDFLYDEARKLVEAILMNTQSLNLCSIPHFISILSQLEGKKLASFCKILTVTISDLDIYKDHKSYPLFSEIRKFSTPLPVKDINQELILSVSGFLERLVSQATSLPYMPRFASLPTEIDHWIRLIDDVISDELARPSSSIEDSSSESLSTLVGEGLMDRVEALYVLSLFLVGRHRKRVQKELSELHLVPKLSNLFDQLIWRYNSGRQRARLPGHTPRCECSPEVAVKMQFLRLIYGFCDQNYDYKHLLLSPYEWEELKRIQLSESVSVQDLDLSQVPPISQGMRCNGTSGLLTKIVEVLKRENINSTYRFWLCRAIESYIRGKISYADQVFLLRRGLLQHIAVSLINTDRRQKEIIQSSFDLLGELIKFNIDACRQIDAILSMKSKLKKAMSLVNERLVDSNMFIRGMVLASDHFLNCSDTKTLEFVKKSRLFSFFRELERHVSYVVKLIRKIKLNNLTQENVSCLNTSLIILMLSHRKQKLPIFLEELAFRAQREHLHIGHTSSSPFMLQFQKLLLFWQDHYSHKAKDCTQLEQSSRISFDFWKSTVDTLVSTDAGSKTSLLYYYKKQVIDNNKSARRPPQATMAARPTPSCFTSFMETE